LAKIGEVSAQYSECTDGGIWKCIQGLEWSQENWSCLAPVSIFCKQKYWVHAIWRIQLNKDGSYMCWCESGYLLKNKQCVIK
jgi:hypothetical protein